MKGEVVKYKIRLRETQAELNQVGREIRNWADCLQSQTKSFLNMFSVNKIFKTEHENGNKLKTCVL